MNHLIWWLRNENNFGEIVYDYGDKPIQIGDNWIVWVGYFLIKFGDDSIVRLFKFFGDSSVKSGDIIFDLVINTFIAF